MNGTSSVVMLVVMIAIFYFLLIRPENKRKKAAEQMRNNLKKGDTVLAGQLIGEADGFVSANIVSSCSGTVKAVENRRTASGAKVMSVVIENDGQYTLAEGIGVERDYKMLGKEEILGSIQKAGIVGMGGAGFPVHVKLAPKNADEIRYIIANGAECEP